ncbi:hypothetical protein AB0K00_20985 [Dactylosporangium sp. NPDC049525]
MPKDFAGVVYDTSVNACCSPSRSGADEVIVAVPPGPSKVCR